MKIGVMGTGNIARAHLAGYRQVTNRARVVAIADPNREAAEAFAAQFDSRPTIYSDWRELLEKTDVDAVDLCLPHDLHCPVAVAAAASGRHVLVEKPIARTLEEADQMISAADGAGVKLMVCHDRRYHPLFAKIKELVDAGAIGRIQCVRLDHNQNVVFPEGEWPRSKEKLGGGAIMSCLVHQFDAMRWFAGEVAQVGCISLTWPERMEGESIGVVPMRFQSGAVGDAVINWAVQGRAAPKNALWYELIWITGEGGNIHNLGGLHLFRNDDGTGEYKEIPVDAGSGHARAIEHFIDCILEDKEPLTSGREGRATLEVAMAAYQSEATETLVRLPLKKPYYSATAS